MGGSSTVGASSGSNNAASWSSQIPPLVEEFGKLRGVASSASPQNQISATDSLLAPSQAPTIATFKVSIPSPSNSLQANSSPPATYSSSVSAATSPGSGTGTANLGQLLQGTSFAGANPPTSNTFSSKVKGVTPFVSESALQLVKVFEGFKANSYTGAGAGDKTIGFGSSELSGKSKVLSALAKGTVTIEEAEDLMLEEVKDLRPVIEKHFGSQLNPNQFGVLTSLAYNGGEQALIDLKSKSGGNLQKVGEILPSFYVTSGGQYLEGLSNRRKVEQKLWNTTASA